MSEAINLRDVRIIARFELGEALRTRLLVVMVLLFVGGGGLSAWGFCKFLERMEAVAAKALAAPQARKPGATLESMRRSPMYRDLMRAAAGDDDKAAYFSSLPPMVLFYAWITLALTPWLVLFTSSDTISTEVASRSIRYTMLRTGHLEYAVGKFIGQAVIVAGVIVLCGLTFYLVSWGFLSRFDHAETLGGIVAFWPRIFVHTLPFLGFALLASMLTSSGNLARVGAMGGAILLAILSGLAGWDRIRGGGVSDAIWDLVTYLTPFDHSGGLLYPHGAVFWTDVVVCLALTVVYFGLGYLRLRKRDL